MSSRSQFSAERALSERGTPEGAASLWRSMHSRLKSLRLLLTIDALWIYNPLVKAGPPYNPCFTERPTDSRSVC